MYYSLLLSPVSITNHLMDLVAQDPLLYWLLWAIATLIGVLLGWTLRAQWREKTLLAAYEQSEQERNSIAHLYSQLRTHYDQKTADLHRAELEFSLLQEKMVNLERISSNFDAHRKADQAALEQVQNATVFAQEKALLLEENIRYLRMRDQQQSSEIQRLHEELKDSQPNRIKIIDLQTQLEAWQQQCLNLEQQKAELLEQLEVQKKQVAQLQKNLDQLSTLAEGDSDQRDLTYPSGHSDEEE
ncbi:MAG: hypothetical protein ACK5SQ_10085 [Chitinophagales bacterium]|jgi:hypothetical protein